jgi:hypothetical protein
VHTHVPPKAQWRAYRSGERAERWSDNAVAPDESEPGEEDTG